MVKKIGMILLGLSLLGLAGFIWLWVRPRLEEGWLVGQRGAASIAIDEPEVTEEEADPLAVFLRKILTAAGVTGQIEEGDFSWNYKTGSTVEEIIVPGQTVRVEGLLVNQLQQARDFFRSQEMENDLYNAADGTVGGQEGWVDTQTGLACLVVNGIEDPDFEDQPTYRLTISCGKVDPTLFVPPISTEDALKQAFADKYTKPLADVMLEVTEELRPFAKGVVRFAGEISGAMWLAYRNQGTWEIVFDGNGTVPCANIEPYNFPTQMAPECWDESTSQLIVR